MNRAILAAVGILTVAGCGPLFPDHWMTFDTISVPDAGDATAAAVHAADDAKATRVFAVYGNDAVHTCLAAFHREVVNGGADTAAAATPLSYRAQLAAFLCDCARGQSAVACPDLSE